MQKRWTAAAIATTLVLGISVGAAAVGIRKHIEVDYSGVKIKVDGKIVDTANAQPFIVVEEGRTYVPARYLAEAMGAKVGFDGQTNTVLVYTPNHVEAKVQGDVTTFSFPYYGASLQWPAGGSQRPNKSFLLQLQSANAVLQVNRVDFHPAMGFDQMVKAMMAALQSTLAFNVTGERPVIAAGAVGAKEMLGTVKIAGQETPMRLRFVADEQNMWLMMVITIPQGNLSEEAVTRYLDTFSFGK